MQLTRITASGTLDTAFSGDGRADVPAADGGGSPDARELEVDSSGNLFVLHQHQSDESDVDVAKMSPTGIPVAAFGGNGISDVAVDPDQFPTLAVDAVGRPIVISPSGDSFELARLTTTGAPDETYGPGGLVTVAGPNSAGSRIVVAGDTAYVATCLNGPVTHPAVVALDLTSATLETTFAPGGTDGDGVRSIPFDPDTDACADDIALDGSWPASGRHLHE